jgi:hypothetical protein
MSDSEPSASVPAAQHFVRCHYCEAQRKATECGSVENRDPEHGPPSLVTLAQCNTCGQALLFVQEEYHWSEGWDELTRVWPGARRQLSIEVPEPLRAEHSEAHKCLDSRAYTAAVVMVRRTIEGVCANHGIKERNLHGSLTKMRDNGLLDQRLLDWAQALRVLGNEGAHYTGKQVSREDAVDALALAEALLDNLYVLTAKFKEFTDRRSARENGSPTHTTEA